jgi:hypothetical protein
MTGGTTPTTHCAYNMCVADGVGNSTLFPNGLTGLYDALQVRRKRLLGPLLYQKDRC